MQAHPVSSNVSIRGYDVPDVIEPATSIVRPGYFPDLVCLPTTH
jgi:hypothetical protein